MSHPSVPCSRVELRIRCRNLLDRDIMSKSDPCAVLYSLDRGRWYEIGRTENIKNCLNPEFSHSFELDYYFEEVQKLKVAVYDIDNKTPQLDDDDFLGECVCTLGEIVSSSPLTKPLVLISNTNKQAGKGTITLHAEELERCNEVLTLSFKAIGLDKKDFLGKSDPFLEFSKQVEGGGWSLVHRTEVIKRNLNPVWKPFHIKAAKLCSGDFNRPFKVACYDHDGDGSHDFIGTFSSTVNQLKSAVDAQVQWSCMNPKKKAKKKDYKHSGTVFLTKCSISIEHSFLDFIFGGLQLNFTIAIDFTKSNGDPHDARSLHYMDPNQPNQYQQALEGVGAVVQDYDSDKMFPAFGFGALIPPQMQVSHEFAINFDNSNPFCAGIQGVVGAYRSCLLKVQLYGPTNFAPIIRHVANFGRSAQREKAAKNYFILMIMTDGIITDMPETRQAIVSASNLPMSIIIVGIGNADFAAMDMLDCDNGLLTSPTGQKAMRDIVQFVPYRNFINREASSVELAKHVLAEVPKQVTDYFRIHGIGPIKRGTNSAPGNGASTYPGGAGQPPYPGSAGQPQYPGSAGQSPYPGGAGQPPYPGSAGLSKPSAPPRM